MQYFASQKYKLSNIFLFYSIQDILLTEPYKQFVNQTRNGQAHK